MKKIFLKRAKIFSVNSGGIIIILILLISLASLVKFDWVFDKKSDDCKVMVDRLIEYPRVGLQEKNLSKIKDDCYAKILKSGSYKDLYAYYRMYKFIDNLSNDKGADNIYHWMLFYANENSRIFNDLSGEFEKEHGLYEKELKQFEDNMTQEERMKSFAYIADNLATGKAGWVKKNNYKKSFEYLSRAAEEGDVKLQIYLGYSYFTGRGWMNKVKVDRDYSKCYKWLHLSTIHSKQKKYLRTETIESLNKISQSMSPKEIYNAKNMVDIWLEKNSKFVKNNPLVIIKMTEEEVEIEKKKTQHFIIKYNLNNPN